MMGYGGYGGMFTWLILIIIAGVVIYSIFNRGKRSGNPNDPQQESPVEILKKRYANGEISKEEFDRIKKDLES
jgi:putative membrane protein